ncbi:hypothetical protein JW848_00945 [Candidatus Bipolaricaulota bacterium]|nr:hypothetical protein [Candidatus Bipolaricaulota bacterium]
MKRGMACLLIIVCMGVSSFATCYNSDSPDCSCFDASATWNPNGTWIQDIALDTVGTIESCESDGGKPFYQVRLGLNSRSLATTVARMLESLSGIMPSLFDREAWCSETISYWHREAGIPYSTGYRRSSWHLDWQLTNTEAIRTFYLVEELLGWFTFLGGRGRWIDWGDLDYSDFRPGINAPAPGSYVLIREYDAASATWTGNSHSMMINEMTIHKNGFGDVVRVEVSLLDGNGGSPGRVRSTTILDDLVSYTPAGPDWLGGGRKILGFGVDLRSNGSPLFDPGRLHIRRQEFGTAMPFDPFATTDPIWEQFYAPLVLGLAEYAMKVTEGPVVIGPSSVIGRGGLPDGQTAAWTVSPEINRAQPTGTEITIDLLQDHPLPVRGMVLSWEGTVPMNFSVRYAADGEAYQEAITPQMLSSSRLVQFSGGVLLPIPFGEGGSRVRTIQLHFPHGSLLGEARLTELRFIYDWGPGKDAEFNPPLLEPSAPADGGLSIRISASSSVAHEAEYSHVLVVSWKVGGGASPYRLNIEVTNPNGETVIERDDALEGTRRFELLYPEGGTARVSVEVEDAVGSTASGAASVTLDPV